MQTRSLWYIGGSFVSALIAAISAVQTVNGFVSDTKQISWWWASSTIIFFLVFCALVYFGWYSEYRRAKNLEDLQPSIKVTPRIEGKYAFLDLETDKKAVFSFKITNWTGIDIILPPPPMVFPYFAKWVNTHDLRNLDLIAGDCHSIELIEFDGQTLNQDDPNDKSLQKVQIPSDWVIREGRIYANKDVTFTVAVNSEPPSKSTFNRIYILSTTESGQINKFQEVI